MSQGSAILLDRVQVTTLLKDTQKNRLNLDDEQLRGVYLRLVPVNEDPDPEKVLRIYDLCPCLVPFVEADGQNILSCCFRTLEEFVKEEVSCHTTTHHNMACLKVLVHLIDNEVEGQEASDLLFKILTSDNFSVEVPLVAATSLARLERKLGDTDALAETYSFLLDRCEAVGEFATSCMVSGVLNSGENEVLLNEELLVKIVNTLESYCAKPMTHAYQNFQSLTLLSLRLKELASRETLLPDLIRDRAPKMILEVVAANWEHPLKGVPDLVSSVFANTLDLMKTLDEKNYQLVVSEMTREFIEDFGWQTKAKYPALVSLMPRVGVASILEKFDGLGINLAQTLRSNYLATSGAAVYKCAIQELTLDDWEKHFCEALARSLTSEKEIIANNAINHWLAATIKSVEGSGEKLASKLAQYDESGRELAAILLILKVERLQGSVKELNEAHWRRINSCGDHLLPSVRWAAFSAVCCTKKKGSAPTSMEVTFIKNFLETNMAVDCAAFRQNILGDFAVVLLRCRDFLTTALRRKKFELEVTSLIQHLDSILEMLFANCFPGANYQRLSTALQLLSLFSEIFFDCDSSVGKNKASGNASPAELLELCRSKSIFTFKTKKHLGVLLFCMQFYMGDIRELAQSLLEKFQVERHEIEQVLVHSVKLINSPKFSDCENGAGMIQMVSRWLKKSNLQVEDVLKDDLIVQCNPVKGSLIEGLIEAYSVLLGKSEANFLVLAKESPMHGIFTAIRFLLTEELLKESLIVKLVAAIRLSTDSMLSKLGGSRDSNASFAEIDEALDELAEDDDPEDVTNNSISEERRLVLACAWLNLKECSLLSAKLIETQSLSPQLIKMCMEVMIQILTRCRHKGAIMAAEAAVKNSAECLLVGDERKVVRHIPEKILDEILDQLESFRPSVTRRSAGLPMLVMRIVSGEQKGCRRLLEKVVKKLLPIVAKAGTDIEETRDDPRAHALHILRSLVHDSSLAADIAPHISEIFMECVRRFSDRSWAVRNAALQLFGALVPRMLGQKKVREDESGHNTLPATEFFVRHSDVIPFLVDRMNQKEKSLTDDPALVPLLAMLCRIRVGDEISEPHFITIEAFKAVFNQCLGNRVINVRQLAAKAFCVFTRPSSICKEVDATFGRVSRSLGNGNLAHGCLTCLKDLLKRWKAESPDLFSSNLLEIREKLDDLCGSKSLRQLSPLHKIIVQDLCDICDCSPMIDLGDEKDCVNYAPGSYKWGRRQGLSPGETKSGIPDSDPKTLVDYFLEGLQNETLSGHSVEKCNELLLKWNEEPNFPDPETALDLLEASTHQRLTDLGLSAVTSSLPSAAAAFAAMMTQSDSGMFFKNESPYTAQFMEFTETLIKFCNPTETETSRLRVTSALIRLIPAFRDLDSRPLLLKYGFVNLANAGLELLTDEDTEVRDATAKFVSKLMTASGKASNSAICAFKAPQELTRYGLEHFSECLEWFRPVVNVFFEFWRGGRAVDILAKSVAKPLLLFEAGDGVNVFAEVVTSNKVYEKTIRMFLTEKENAFKLDIDPELVADEVEDLLCMCEAKSTEVLFPFSTAWSKCGFSLLQRAFHLLKLFKDFPQTTRDQMGYFDKRDLIPRLEEMLHL